MGSEARTAVKRVATAWAGLSLSLCPVQAARAHDLWADGGPVPGWVKAQCCGPSDAHHLTAGQVHVTPHGYRLDGCSRAIAQDKLLPSPDGSWWVFYRDCDDGSQSTVHCFFGPDSGS